MANPIQFKPQPVDPKQDLQLRLEKAPVEHGEALLVLWGLLEVSHREGILDLLYGLVGRKNYIAGKVSEYAKLPEGVAGIRNILSIAKILATLDPEVLNCLANSMDIAMLKHEDEAKTPGLWALSKRVVSEDSRRGLSFATLLLSEFGKALKH